MVTGEQPYRSIETVCDPIYAMENPRNGGTMRVREVQAKLRN